MMRHLLQFFIVAIFFIMSSLSFATLPLVPPIHPIAVAVSEELSSAEHELLSKGNLVFKEKEIKGEALPQYSLYQLIEASAEESFALFSDLENQKNYVPNLKLSRIEKIERANSLWASYQLETPWPLPDAKYTTRNEFWSDGKGNFQLLWDQIESNSTDETKGEARFLSFEGKTIFVYTNHIRPKIRLASIFKSRFREDVTLTYKAIVREILESKIQKKNLLNWQMSLAREILSGKNPYAGGFSPRPIAKD